jgi:hypothetical protein
MPAATGKISCLQCYLKHKSCCGSQPNCSRCLRAKNQSIPCTWREGDVTVSGTITAPADKFIEELASVVRQRKTRACNGCREDKKACDGNVEAGCERCRARGIACVFRGVRAKPAPSSPKKRVRNRSKTHPTPDLVASNPMADSVDFMSTDAGLRKKFRTPSSNSRGSSKGPLDTYSETQPLAPPVFPRTVFLPPNGFDSGPASDFQNGAIPVDQVHGNGSNGSWSGSSPTTSTESLEGESKAISLPSNEYHGEFRESAELLEHAPEHGFASLGFSSIGSVATTFSDLEAVPAPFVPFWNSAGPYMTPYTIVPLAPTQSWIPDQQVINIFVDSYLTYADITLNMLNRRTFHNSTTPTLLLASILLLVPHLASLDVGSDWTPHARSAWTRTLFQLCKQELLAFLDSSKPPTCEILAAVVNLYMFSIVKGQIQTGRRLVILATQLLVSMGLVANVDTMEPPLGLLSWTETLEAVHGSDVSSRMVQPNELDQMLDLWIEYWTRERITQLLLYIKWAQM